jgi:hypothetical protein
MSESVNAESPAAKTPVRWPAEAIWQAVVPRLPAFTVEILPQIDSTIKARAVVAWAAAGTAQRAPA